MSVATVILGSSRGGFLLTYEGYTFEKNKQARGKIYWRCSNRSCDETMHTNIFNIKVNSNATVIKEPVTANHSHPPCQSFITRQILLSQMSDIVRADPCAPVRAAYGQTIATNASLPHADIPIFSNVNSYLRRRRASCFPAIPTTINDVNVVGEWSRTWNDKLFVQHIDNAWGILVFATPKNLKLLGRCDTIYVDGTFRSAPHPYMQMLTIHAMYMGSVVPLCFALVSGKTTGQYRQVFQKVRVSVRHYIGHRWRPTTVICDFELSLIAALETEFAGIRVRGCYFHFSQSLWRKFASLSLVPAYNRSNSRGRRLKKCVQKLLAIGFLPVLLVRANFVSLCNSRQVFCLKEACSR